MNNTIHNVPRELLERVTKYCVSAPDAIKARNEVRALLSAPSPANHVEDVRAMVAAPSPAGVDGCRCSMSISVLGDGCRYCQPQEYIDRLSEMLDEERAELSDAQAIIDGLRGEVAGLRKRAKTAEREAGSALRTYKGLEKVARVVSDNSDQVCGELNVLRQQFDQQARRNGELEGLLREARLMTFVVNSGQSGVLRGQIDAALSAGKDSAS